MAWSWVGAELDGMAAGEFKQINTNRPDDVALSRTRTNFDAGSYYASDAAVATAIKAADNGVYDFSGQTINEDTGEIMHRGGGHNDGGDGSIFMFDTSTLAWTLAKKGPRYESTAPTVSCSITAIASGTPPRLTVDADIVIDGDQVVVSGTTDADGTYQAVRVDSTHVDLYNVDGDTSGQFSAYSGGSLTDSTGTLTITWNPQGVDGGNDYAHTNADGDQMPPVPHTAASQVWAGNDLYCLGGYAVFSPNGGAQQNRLWFYDHSTGEVTRGYHDARTGNDLYLTIWGFGGRNNGPVAYNPWDGQVYAGDAQATIFEYKTYRWATDFLTKGRVTGGGDWKGGFPAIVLPVPGATTTRMMFAMYSTTQWMGTTDIESGGSPSAAKHSWASTLFTTGMIGVGQIGICYDPDNDSIVYWGAGSTIGEITTDSNLGSWDSAELTPATPTGDTPSSTGSTNNCSIAKVPDYDAYLLCQAGNVYLYARSAISLGINVSVGQVTETDSAQSILASKAKSIGQATETDNAQSTTVGKSYTINQVNETNAAQAISALKALGIAQVNEADSAFGMTSPAAIIVSLVTETDSAFSIAMLKTLQLDQVTETDISQAISMDKSAAVGQVAESDIAQSIALASSSIVGQVVETDVAQAISSLKAQAIGFVSETDAAQAIIYIAGLAIGQVLEADLAQSISSAKSKAIGQAVETELAQSIGYQRIVALAQATESDTAFSIALTKAKAIGLVTETDIAQAMTVIGGNAIAGVTDPNITSSTTLRSLVSGTVARNIIKH